MTHQEIADSAIKALEEAVNEQSKKKILEAYKLGEDPSLNWDFVNPESGNRWDLLVDWANDILYQN